MILTKKMSEFFAIYMPWRDSRLFKKENVLE